MPLDDARARSLIRKAAALDCQNFASAHCYDPTRLPDQPGKWCLPCEARMILADGGELPTAPLYPEP